MKWRRFAAWAALLMGAWMLTGIEVVGLEHSNKYVPFIKARPSLQLLYRNPVMCGECNFRSYTTLDVAERETFEAFCRARFGLDDPRLCNAVFAEEQRIAEQDVGSKRP